MGPHDRSTVKSWWYASVVLVVLGLDQLSKRNAEVLNTGVAFGWGGAFVTPLLVALFFVFATLITAWLFRAWWESLWWSHAMFVGASLGNLLDRWMLAGVRDPWVIPVFNLRNNLADWILVLVALYWVWYLYANERTFSDDPNSL